MRVVVTGGTGFLGTHLARHLAEADASVRVLDLVAPASSTGGPDVEHLAGDVRDQEVVGRALVGADVVVHAAFAPPGAGPATMAGVNVGGTENVCAAARDQGVERVIVISSTIVNQPPRWSGPLRRSALARLNAYRSTRVAAEAVAARFADGGLPVAVVRPKTFVGPERVGAFALVFDLIRRGGVVLLPGRGANRYQLLDIRDFAAGLRLLAVNGGDGLFNFGALEFGTVAEDLRALVDHAGTGARLRPTPSPLVRAGLRAAELAGLPPWSEWYQCGAGDQDSVVDLGRALEVGWRPQRSNAQALADAYDWYLRRLATGGAAPTTHPVPRAHRALSSAIRAVLR